jgi:hypothetical protein
MKSIWKGSIAFGLVNIPVRLYSATESQSLSSHLLYKKRDRLGGRFAGKPGNREKRQRALCRIERLGQPHHPEVA